nr:atherin-like [Pongo pygmaeus]
MHTSAGPHTCGAATKFPRAACARNWGAPRADSEQLPSPAPLHVPPPRPGPAEPSGGGEGTGEELPWAAAPPRPRPPSRPRRLLARRGSPARSPSCSLAAPPPEPRLLPRPQPLSPQTFRQDGGLRAGLPRSHVTAFPVLSANGNGSENKGVNIRTPQVARGGPGGARLYLALAHRRVPQFRAKRGRPGRLGLSEERRDLAYTRSKAHIPRHPSTSLNTCRFQLRGRGSAWRPRGLRPSPVSIADVTQTLTVPLRTHLESRPPKLSRRRPALQAPAYKSMKVSRSCQTPLHLLLSLQQSSSMLPVPRQSLKGKDLMLSKKLMPA